MRRLSGPLLDRIDLVCQIESVPTVELVSGGRTGRRLLHRGAGAGHAARDRQRTRLASTAAHCNADMDGPLTRRMAGLDGAGLRLAARAQPGRVASAGAATTGCCGWRARSPTSTGETRSATGDVEEALGYRLSPFEQVAA